MNTKLLVDAIVRQTTIFIAELCTAAGVRAPLAHIADEVFLGLSRQLEEQGVSRKVAADMFGLALRGYQKKVQRLTESETQNNKTLWQAVVDFLIEERSATRQRILERFRHDPEESVAAILTDLVASGLAYTTGRGGSAVYGATTPDDRTLLVRQDVAESLPDMIALLIFREGPRTEQELRERLRLEESEVSMALALLQEEGRVTRDATTGKMKGGHLLIAVGADKGWEAAVFDHYQCLVKAVVAKLRCGPVSSPDDTVGGATLTFDINPGHPLEAEVLATLKNVRKQVNTLWEQVEQYNSAHPSSAEEKTVVTFYMGQNVEHGLPS